LGVRRWPWHRQRLDFHPISPSTPSPPSHKSNPRSASSSSPLWRFRASFLSSRPPQKGRLTSEDTLPFSLADRVARKRRRCEQNDHDEDFTPPNCAGFDQAGGTPMVPPPPRPPRLCRNQISLDCSASSWENARSPHKVPSDSAPTPIRSCFSRSFVEVVCSSTRSLTT
jgi:hypothetical protein